MDWFVFALLSPMMFAFCNIIDKFILTKKIKDPFSYNIINVSLNIFPIILLIIFLGLNPKFSDLFAVMYGFIFVFLYLVYNKAMMKEDASKVASITKASPIFTLTLSFLFLNEVLNYQKYVGIILLVISALLVSYKKTEKKFHLSSGIALALFYSFSLGVMSIVTKYTLGYVDYWSFLLWNLVGNILGCFIMIIVPKIRRNVIRDAIKINKKTFLAIVSSDIFAWMGYLTYFIAVSLGSVSLTSAVGSIQPLIVFMVALIMTVHAPKILKEETSRESLLFKMLAVILIFIGSYLLLV